MEIWVLGPVAAKTSRGEIEFVGRQAAVLELLALRRGQLVEKERLLEAVWGGDGTPNAVETTIGRIRRALGLPKNNDVLITEKAAAYRLMADTDVSEFEHLARQGDTLRSEGKSSESINAYESALGLWRGEAFRELADSPEARGAIENLRMTRWSVQLRRLELQVSEHRWQQAVLSAETMLEENPYFEQCYAYKAQALHHIAGAYAASQALYEAFQKLQAEGITPSRNLIQLQQQILRSMEGSDDTAPHEPPTNQSYTQGPTPPEELMEAPADDATIVHNLPAPTYLTFVQRDAQWEELSRGFQTGLPIIAMVGLGGNGKSALAREYATYLADQSPAEFKLIVWVSDKEVPGSTTLNTVLDEIAAAADYRGLASRPLPEKRLQAIRILQRTKTLLIIDNFETIVDKELARWLRSIPAPSKVLVTSIVHPRNLDSYCYEIEVGGLTEEERDPFYAQLLRRRNLLDLVEMRSDLAALWSAANGNPKLIEWALGQVKSRGRTIREMAQDMGESRDREAGSSHASIVILKELFRDSWKAMTPTAKDVLTALSCFPYGTTSGVIRRVSGAGDHLEDALEQLQDLCFVTRVPGSAGGASWYLADPLAATRSDTQLGPNTESIQGRWLEYSIELAESVGFCPEEVSRLERFDPAGVRENLEYAIKWAFKHDRYDAVIRLTRGVRYYYYVRGLWSAEPNVNLLRADAAHLTRDVAEEFDALLYFVNIAAKQENRPAIDQYLPRIEAIMKNHDKLLSSRDLAEYRHVRALCLLAQSRHDEAAAEWLINIAEPELLGAASYNANLRWYAICLERKGDILIAGEVLETAREHAYLYHYDRAIFLIDMELASIKLHKASKLQESAKRRVLTEVLDYLHDAVTISTVNNLNDRRYMADYQWLLARVNYLAGLSGEGREHAACAAELYDRLGLTERAHYARTFRGTK